MTDTRPQGQPDEAMVDLLIKQVTEGLSPAEQRALDVLDGELASAYARDLERAAAAVTLAGSSKQQPLPPALAEKLARQAAEHFAPTVNVVDLADARIVARTTVQTAAADQGGRASVHVPARTNRFGGYGWLAAAACLVLAIFGWERSPPPAAPPPIAAVPNPPAAVVSPIPEPAAPTPAEERAALLANSDSLKISLGATKDPAAAGMTGDVVWDPVTQRGFLHFAGLAANDPAVHQYQIWIFDAGRDKRYPVDGGVFDVPANTAEVVIPIRAALMVRKPAAFAVTVEKPGGVVVSGREHVVALGAIG
jgi:Anti-sigma-K factor rskA